MALASPPAVQILPPPIARSSFGVIAHCLVEVQGAQRWSGFSLMVALYYHLDNSKNQARRSLHVQRGGAIRSIAKLRCDGVGGGQGFQDKILPPLYDSI